MAKRNARRALGIAELAAALTNQAYQKGASEKAIRADLRRLCAAAYKRGYRAGRYGVGALRDKENFATLAVRAMA